MLITAHRSHQPSEFDVWYLGGAKSRHLEHDICIRESTQLEASRKSSESSSLPPLVCHVHVPDTLDLKHPVGVVVVVVVVALVASSCSRNRFLEVWARDVGRTMRHDEVAKSH